MSGLRSLFVLLLTALLVSTASAQDGATPVDRLNLLPGFKAELLYSVPSEQQGSWVSMTADDEGRLIVSDQYGRLYRVTPPASRARARSASPSTERPVRMATSTR